MSQTHIIETVEFFTYDISYTDNIEAANEEGACSDANGMKALTSKLLQEGKKELLLEIIQANESDAEVGYYVEHRDASLENLTQFINRISK